jgi:octaprenyl-diphosphate synthase
MDLLQTAVPRTAFPARDLFASIAADLEEVEQILRAAWRSSLGCVRRLVDHLDHYRGKRLRPALLLLTAKACGGISSAHHTLAGVMEMIHTATLVHDDVLDGASLRRYVATVNAGWGNHTSVLLGDFLFTHAFHLASSVDARACHIIGEATNRVCEGELLQCSEEGNLDLGEDEYLAMIDGKTAELTACCCRLGALYGGMAADVVESMSRYGRWLGVAFQIADDLLDLVGEERTTGKSLGTDVQQQKLTLPLIRLLQRGTHDLAARVRQILCTSGNHKRELLLPCLAECDALEYARERAEDYAARARSVLSCLPPSSARDTLESLTDRVIHRNA